LIVELETTRHSGIIAQKVNEWGYNLVLCWMALDYLMMKTMCRI